MEMATIVGSVAGIINIIAFIPQVVKSWKTKQTGDLSLDMYILLTTGNFMWTLYGFVIHSWPLIAANGIIFLLSASILGIKIRNG